MRDIGSRAPRLKAMGSPKALGNRRSGRAGEPAAGESVGASESLDDVPQDPRLPSYPPVGPPVGPTDRLPDLYGSLSARLGISRSNRQLACAGRLGHDTPTPGRPRAETRDPHPAGQTVRGVAVRFWRNPARRTALA